MTIVHTNIMMLNTVIDNSHRHYVFYYSPMPRYNNSRYFWNVLHQGDIVKE